MLPYERICDADKGITAAEISRKRALSIVETRPCQQINDEHSVHMGAKEIFNTFATAKNPVPKHFVTRHTREKRKKKSTGTQNTSQSRHIVGLKRFKSPPDSSGERSHTAAVSKSNMRGFYSSSNEQMLCSACPEGDKKHACYPDEDGNMYQLCTECASCNGVWV
jgi:hypothetical protein